MRCVACGGITGTDHVAREMMFGTRDIFKYAECSGCGTLTLTDPPTDFTPYYPPSYYSLAPSQSTSSNKILRDRLCLLPFIGRLLAQRRHDVIMRAVFQTGLRNHWRVLDVGCGAGQLLGALADAGCRHLVGVDAFMTNGGQAGIDLRRGTIFDIEDGPFDLIMFHHSFEHMAEPDRILAAVCGLLSSRGVCLVRIPVVGWAWKEYGVNWVQLDAPRHLFLYSTAGFRRLAQQCGFVLVRTEFDSSDFQFWASEMYSRDVPLSEIFGKPPSITEDEKKNYCIRAEELNSRGLGDQAAFYLQPHI